MSRLNADPSQEAAGSENTDVEMVEEKPKPSKWAYIHYRPRGPRGFDNDSVAIASTYGGRLIANVERRNLPRLDDGMWLVTVLVDFHCFEVRNAFIERNPERLMDLCVLSSTSWFTCSQSQGKWTNASFLDSTSPLDYKYVAFPMNASNTHWALGIITHASDLLIEHNPKGPIRTSLLILNSIHGYNPRDLKLRYQDFIRLLSIKKPMRPGALSKVKVFEPKVLQQPNGTDCGLYPGHFLSTFLSDPGRYESVCKGELDPGEKISELWLSSRVAQARENLRALVDRACIVRSAAHTFHSGRTPADLGLDY